MSLRVAIVAEYYPRADAPALGIWAHRQTLAARSAGADVQVIVLNRPLPPLRAVRERDLPAITRTLRQPRRVVLDGIEVEYVPFLAPPRPWSYGTWGAWAAPSLKVALRRLRDRFDFDLIHAHYASPAGAAVVRACPEVPMVVSVHGGDVLGVVEQWPRTGGRAVRGALAQARLVLANSQGIEGLCRRLGARETRVVHLGADLPPQPVAPVLPPRVVTVGNLVARKRHEDVLRALALIAGDFPELRWEVVGDGPERARLERLAVDLGLAGRVLWRGALPHAEALRAANGASVFVLPSRNEAFGVAYVEAMAAGVPAIGCSGEHGPEEIARHGGGLELVPARDPRAIAEALAALVGQPELRRSRGAAARETVRRHFTWDGCGRNTVAAYEDALA